MTNTATFDGQWVDDELTIIETMATELEAYIVRGNVYRTIVISTANGKRKRIMSGGDLLARIHRLREYETALSTAQQSRFETVAGTIQTIIDSLRTRFHDGLRRELKARRDQLTWNVELRREQEDEQADAAEIHNRQHIAAIQRELHEESSDE